MQREYLIAAGLISLMLMIPAGLILASGGENTEFVKGEEVNSQISPIGSEITDVNQYRFSDTEDGMLFGPYIVEGDRYFVRDGEVLNPSLEQIENQKVEGLHQFYLKTYTDPLFYSPQKGEMDLSGFERFEKGKVLTENCGLEYNTVPQKYLNNLDQNHNTTENFLNYASYENAQSLISQNRKTTSSYSKFIGNYIDLLTKEISDNKCFKDNASNEGIALATNTPVQYRIDTEIMTNYVRMANSNAQRLNSEINNRSDLLNSEKEFNWNIRNTTVKQISFDFKNTYGRLDAKEEFNERRKSEVVGLNLGSSQEEEENTEESEGEEAEENETEVSETNETENTESEENTEEEDAEKEFNLTEKQKENLRTVEEVPYKYDIQPYCLEDSTVPIYGWDRNVYPNVILGQDILFEQNKDYLKDFFTTCRCPYVEITRLKWHTTDGLHREIKNDLIYRNYTGPSKEKIEKAEKVFVNDPGEKTLDQLSSTYEEGLKTSLKNGQYSEKLPEMWKRSTQESSQLQAFEPTYDDFYNEYHMKVWRNYFPIDMDEKYSRVQYNYFLISGSEYPLTFMTWSDSVWRLDKKPEKLSGAIGDENLDTAAPGA